MLERGKLARGEGPEVKGGKAGAKHEEISPLNHDQ